MSEVVLRTRNVTQRFGGLVAVNDVSMELQKGEIVAIIGPNGAGKTTLFHDIHGVYRPNGGSILYRETDITGKKPYEVACLGLARTFQNIRLMPSMTVLENVMLGFHAKTRTTLLDAILRTGRRRREEQRVESGALDILEQTGLADYRFHGGTSLPYGLQRRLEIARAMAAEPEVLLLDEPAAGMNEQETIDLIAFIRQLRDDGYTILLIEHDMKLVMNLCDRIYVLDHGVAIAAGLPEEIRSNPKVIEAYLGKEE